MDHHLPTYTTCSPHESSFTSGYHFTKISIYPPNSTITTFTRIILITHDSRRSLMDHHLTTTFSTIVDDHPWIIIYLNSQHVNPTNLHLPPDIISRQCLFTHQNQISHRLPASFLLPTIFDVHSWILFTRIITITTTNIVIHP